MHKRKDIIANQAKFRDEISTELKKEFTQLRKDVNKIRSKDPDIIAGKESMNKKIEKVNVTTEINKLFISPKNLYPEYYAWWEDEFQQVVKLKYNNF
jgi:hypothetical protein